MRFLPQFTRWSSGVHGLQEDVLNILSPIACGSGVEVLHRSLATGIPSYQLRCYSPWWSLFPPVLAGFSDHRADLVHANSDYGVFFKRRKIPLVATMHGYSCDTFMRPYCSRLQYLHYRTDLKLFTRMTLEAADQTVAVSRFVIARVSEDLGVKVPMRLIYNGVDERRFAPSGSIGRSLIGPCRVLFCGNLKRGKRPELLVPLANALGNRFEIYYTAGLAQAGAVRESPLPTAAKLIKLGKVAHSNMPDVYRHMDVLFMPSVREGFGLCVAEAMASGLPVVACGESATPELVVDQLGGYLCPIDDLDCYAGSIRSLAESAQRSRLMGEYNRARVEEKFTLSRMVREYQELFTEVMDAGVIAE